MAHQTCTCWKPETYRDSHVHEADDLTRGMVSREGVFRSCCIQTVCIDRPTADAALHCKNASSCKCQDNTRSIRHVSSCPILNQGLQSSVWHIGADCTERA